MRLEILLYALTFLYEASAHFLSSSTIIQIYLTILYSKLFIVHFPTGFT
ncbi:MAG: hypothetical protein IPJ03_09145 [Ignavibacteriales bacterium]|nr:hypothetical protein [Ignavibacteriales bacterium]